MTKSTKRTPRTKDVLRYARNLLINKGWCQGAFARNREGISTEVKTEKGYYAPHSFCAVGALDNANHVLKASKNIHKSL